MVFPESVGVSSPPTGIFQSSSDEFISNAAVKPDCETI